MTAIEHARAMAQADVAERIEWVDSDLGSLEPPPRHFDLVSSLYVNVGGSVSEMATRLATGVAPGGALFLVGHLPVDPATGEPTSAAGQVQVTVADAVEALDAREWNIVLAEERTRAGNTGADAVVRASRRVTPQRVTRTQPSRQFVRVHDRTSAMNSTRD